MELPRGAAHYPPVHSCPSCPSAGVMHRTNTTPPTCPSSVSAPPHTHTPHMQTHTHYSRPLRGTGLLCVGGERSHPSLAGTEGSAAELSGEGAHLPLQSFDPVPFF